MGAYKCDVVVLIKTGPYIHGCLFCVVAYYPDIHSFVAVGIVTRAAHL